VEEDNEIIHHYLIAVAVESAVSSNPGKMYMKYLPIHWTSEDTKKLNIAKETSECKLFPSGITMDQALDMFAKDSRHLLSTMDGFFMSVIANQCSIHHFTSEFEIEEIWFEELANMANTIESSKELLNKSKIRG